MAATVREELVASKPKIVTVRGDSSYATGGYALSASLFDTALAGVAPGGAPAIAVGINDLGTIIAEFDQTNKKVKFITRATGAEVANASDQSAVTVKVLVYA